MTQQAMTTVLAAFAEGFAAPFAGFRHMRRHPELWRYGVVPLLLNLLITVFVFGLLVFGVVAFATYLHPKFPAGILGVVSEILCAIGLLVLAIGAAAATWVLMQGILCGHYYEKLARQVEIQLGARAEDLKDIPLRHQVADALYDGAALAAINTGCLMLNCIPVVGSIVGLVVALYFDSYIFGREYLDFPLELRGMRRLERRAFARQYRAHTLGLGAVVLLFNLIPLAGALVLTTAATGAVLLHRRLSGIAGPALVSVNAATEDPGHVRRSPTQ